MLLFESEFVHIVAISFTSLILTELLMVALTIQTWHWLMIVGELLSLACYVASLVFLHEFIGEWTQTVSTASHLSPRLPSPRPACYRACADFGVVRQPSAGPVLSRLWCIISSGLLDRRKAKGDKSSRWGRSSKRGNASSPVSFLWATKLYVLIPAKVCWVENTCHQTDCSFPSI